MLSVCVCVCVCLLVSVSVFASVSVQLDPPDPSILVVASSTGGKTVFIENVILNVCRN